MASEEEATTITFVSDVWDARDAAKEFAQRTWDQNFYDDYHTFEVMVRTPTGELKKFTVEAEVEVHFTAFEEQI
jgi:hypothetical protein